MASSIDIAGSSWRAAEGNERPYLLYAVMSSVQPNGSAVAPDSSMLQGVMGQPIFYIRSHNLDVAASLLNDTSALMQPDTTEIVAYNSVVSALHRHCDVLPLRYGSCSKGVAEAQELLSTNHAEYTAMLTMVAGCTEMSVSLLIDDQDQPLPAQSFSGSGTDYLKTRRLLQKQQNERIARARALGLQCRQVLAPWVVSDREELLPIDGVRSHSSNLVLHFLIHRQHVQSFRITFRGLQQQSPIPMLLSGPWPPYNFTR